MNAWPLPSPYEDELWYSVVARGLRDWGYVNRASELTQIHGLGAPTISVAAPLRPHRVAGKLPAFLTTDFVLRHTLVPYYLAFVHPDKQQAVLDLLSNTTDPMAKLNLGTSQNRLVPTWLRFCKACIEIDRADAGESYWRRTHQLPGGYRCELHDLLLNNSEVSYHPSRLEYWTAHPSRCKASSSTQVLPSMGHSLSTAIAEVSGALLKSRRLLGLWMDRHRYAELLTQCGFGAAGGRIAKTHFETAFAGFLQEHGTCVSAFGPSGWWRSAFTGVPGSLVPLQHMVLREFLRDRMAESAQWAPCTGVIAAHARMSS